MSLKRDIELLYEVGCMRFIQRQWRQFLNADFQNNAEHSFRVMWLAYIIASHEKVKDVGKVLKMALVHDMSESRSGDLHYVSRQYSSRDESKAIQDTLGQTILEKELIELWEEYEEKKTKEAQIVKDADNLDVDLELKEQEERGHNLRKFFSPIRLKVKKSQLFTKTAKKMWDEIQKSEVHDWHFHARNRYNEGDWKK
jgi:putative hydrolase of HD superfamily